jgi:tetratricopeptide (TPR) repeat protein
VVTGGAPHFWGDVMAESSPALHHLKMAKAYLDEARDTDKNSKEANRYVSEAQVAALSKAATHLNKARELDPTAVLEVEDKEKKTVLRYNQDFLTGLVLCHEGLASINAGRDLLMQATSFEKIDTTKLRESESKYISARDALEKSLKYNPYDDDALKFLTDVYSTLADKENYRRIIVERIKQNSDDMDAHKSLDRMSDPNFKMDSIFKQPLFTWTFNKVLVLTMVLGFLLIPIAANAHLTVVGGAACFMVVIPPIIWWLRGYL